MVIPTWPLAGSAVADEMDKVCPLQKDDKGNLTTTCPAIDGWHFRLENLKKQLEVVK